MPLADALTLGALADNGGGTLTLTLTLTLTPALALAAGSGQRVAGSAAIDAGVGCASAQPGTEQRGLTRAWPDTPDLGAYEYGAPSGPGDIVFHHSFEGIMACCYAALLR